MFYDNTGILFVVEKLTVAVNLTKYLLNFIFINTKKFYLLYIVQRRVSMLNRTTGNTYGKIMRET